MDAARKPFGGVIGGEQTAGQSHATKEASADPSDKGVVLPVAAAIGSLAAAGSVHVHKRQKKKQQRKKRKIVCCHELLL